MRFISHRGNLYGPAFEKENHPDYIREALHSGFDVEIDVWWVDNCFYLGHDLPMHKIDVEFLKQEGLWCHAKNHSALIALLNIGVHVFSHDKDPVVLTSRGIPWAYPGSEIDQYTVCVMPERANYTPDQLKNCYGICSDYIFIQRQKITLE